MKTLNLFDSDRDDLVTVPDLTPAEAARHAFDLTNAEIILLTDEALLAVARVRPFRCRAIPPEPRMPRPDGRRAFIRH